MISSLVYLCLIPERHWGGATIPTASELRIARFAAEALTAERRIRKEVNIDNERRRYSLLCSRIEAEVLKSDLLEIVNNLDDVPSVLGSGKLPAVQIDRTYLDLLRAIIDEDSPGRLGATFFPPGEVQTHLDVFNEIGAGRRADHTVAFRVRSEFFRLAAQAGGGVIEVQQHFATAQPPDAESSAVISELVEIRRQRARDQSKTATVELSAKDLHEVETLKSEYKQRQVQALSDAVIKAIKNKEPANFSNRANDVIAEVLHRFVYVPPGRPTTPSNLRIVYADGSEAPPLNIRCLPLSHQSAADGAEQSPTIRAVLMSMRHVDLDQNVDVAWFRNREVSKARTLAETDEYCYQTTLGLLEDALRDGPLRLHMYHTGFEPAVIGFYRGIVEALLAGRQVSILPYYYRGKDGFELGNWWR